MRETSAVRKQLQETPDLLTLCASEPEFFPAVLESHSYHPKTGRYSILFAAPDQIKTANTPEQLRNLLAFIDQPMHGASVDLPFDHGWFIYLSYEAAAALESRLQDLPVHPDEPLAVAIHCQGSVVIDHETKNSFLQAVDLKTLTQIEQHMAAAHVFAAPGHLQGDLFEPDSGRFVRNIDEALEYIKSGDIYQANLSHEWSMLGREKITPAELYYHLSHSNPAPFAGLLQLDDFAVISSSPERLVSLYDGVLETRPIAGTRPRAEGAEEDDRLTRELIAHPKERAEHIMLIDLQRNDLGRISIAGSVEVDELMVIESYQRVHHIVSNVRSKIKPGVRLFEVLQALFPGGTITGCPKIRCMEIIAELEEKPRGAYTGSFGYINSCGNLDLNILIRSMSLVKGKKLSMHAGAGIVYDSIAEKELAETHHKIRALIESL
ncbi:chorismate-binding protein [Marinicella sp. W31]|uniref:chorismate-binding protein n=1 Tax=Marinicella sp. W31 TaxID=3023713 RepID=UPI0037571E83